MIEKMGWVTTPDIVKEATIEKLNELIEVVNTLVRFQYHQQLNKTVSWDTLEEYERFLREQVESE